MESTEELKKKCYLQAIRYLARRDYSRYKLTQKLEGKGFQSQQIEGVIEELMAKSYLKEEEYQEARIKGLINKGYTVKAICYRLEQEHCPTNSIDVLRVYENLGLTPEEQLKQLIAKKIEIEQGHISHRDKLKSRVLSYVTTRGHSLSEAIQIFEQICPHSH